MNLSLHSIFAEVFRRKNEKLPTHLHINFSKNQIRYTCPVIRAPSDESMETTGLEPATSGLQSRRSPN